MPISSIVIVSARPVPGERAGADREALRADGDMPAAALGHGPAPDARPVERDVERAMVERVGQAAPARPGVIGREDAADEGDDAQPVAAVIAQRIDVPPGIAAWRRRSGRSEVRDHRLRRQQPRQRRHRHARPRMHAAPRPVQPLQARAAARPREARHRAMRRPAVERPARPRKQPAPNPPAASSASGPGAIVSPHCASRAKVAVPALFDLRCRQGGAVAGRRRIDEDEQALGAGARRRPPSSRSCAQT